MIRPATDRPRPRLVEPEDTGPADAAAELKSYLDRIMRLHEERKGLSDDIGEIYKEAKGRGFDRKAMVATVRRLLGDETAFAELDATVDLYLRAYRGTGTEHANAHVSAPAQPVTPHDRHTGEIIEQNPEPVGRKANPGAAHGAEHVHGSDSHRPSGHHAVIAEANHTESVRELDRVAGSAKVEEAAAGGSPTPAAPVDEEADLYQRAVAIVVDGQKASTAYVQRLLGIGYNKAVGLIERMEAEGIVSRADVGGRRTVLKSTEQNPKPGAGVESMGNGGQAEPAETMLEPNLGYAAGRTAEEDIASPEGGRPSPIPGDIADTKSCGGGITTQPTSQEPPDTRITSREPTGTAGLATGPQDAKPLPAQQHRAIGGSPLKPAVDPDDLDAVTRARQSAMPDIPDRFRRAPVAGNA